MPRRLNEIGDAVAVGLLFFGVGATIGLARLGGEAKAVSFRLAVARAITTGGIGMSAGALLLLWPDAPLLALLGAASAFASMGTSALENLIVKILGR